MNQEEFNKILDENKNFLQIYLKNNLLAIQEAKEITTQTTNAAFNQSVAYRHIVPFYFTDQNGRQLNKLYLRSELEEYAAKKREINR